MQSRWESFVEVNASTTLGFLVSWAATPAVFWMFGVPSTGAKNFGITVVFTGLSLARGWVVRRWFNRRA